MCVCVCVCVCVCLCTWVGESGYMVKRPTISSCDSNVSDVLAGLCKTPKRW